MVNDFITYLKNDRGFMLQLSGDRYINPLSSCCMHLDVKESIRQVLTDRGITEFYSHQAKAIEAIRQGENVLLMTPTASGKSLVYNIPVLEAVIEHPEEKALYIFPMKGLEQDQLKALKELANALGIDNAGEVY